MTESTTEQPVTADAYEDCSIDAIMGRAGASWLSASDDAEDRISFPEQFKPEQSVFYDFATFAPLSYEKSQMAFRSRRLDGARYLATRGVAVLQFLFDVGLGQVLGYYPSGDGFSQSSSLFTSRLRALFTDVIQTPDTAPTNEIYALRERLQEAAGVVRLAGKSTLFPFASNPLEPAVQYLEEHNVLEGFKSASRRLPWIEEEYQGDGSYRDDSRGKNGKILDTASNVYPVPNRDRWPGSLPTDNKNGKTWFIGDLYNLRTYLRKTGDFYEAVEDYQDKVRDFLEEYRSAQTGETGATQRFSELSGGLVNRAARTLGEILTEISEVLVIERSIRRPGMKRLALMLTYRHTWKPTGFVKGDLVGYKTLLPGQRELITRKTLVKRQVSTDDLREYAATRESERSETRRESSELTAEANSSFDVKSSASGKFDFAIGSVGFDASTDFGVGGRVQSVHTKLGEGVARAVSKYNEKRQVKVRELLEAEDASEITMEVSNPNKEITANYFYYQLLREYEVSSALVDAKPVLMRARSLPTPVAIDEVFLSRYLHKLIPVLPSQLSYDLQASLSDKHGQEGALLSARSRLDDARADLKLLRQQPKHPPTADMSAEDYQAADASYTRYLSRLTEALKAVSSAEVSLGEAEAKYLALKARIDRVISHLRRHRRTYLQAIWARSPTADHDAILDEEAYEGTHLRTLTGGFARVGVVGEEELYEYHGENADVRDAVSRFETTYGELEEEFGTKEAIKLFRQQRCRSSDSDIGKDEVLVRDPTFDPNRPQCRTIQVARDALVVDALPGNTPLLEGFARAHRMLDVQRTCLENNHLRGRINDATWTNPGDEYLVTRFDGNAGPDNVPQDE